MPHALGSVFAWCFAHLGRSSLGAALAARDERFVRRAFYAALAYYGTRLVRRLHDKALA